MPKFFLTGYTLKFKTEEVFSSSCLFPPLLANTCMSSEVRLNRKTSQSQGKKPDKCPQRENSITLRVSLSSFPSAQPSLNKPRSHFSIFLVLTLSVHRARLPDTFTSLPGAFVSAYPSAPGDGLNLELQHGPEDELMYHSQGVT